MALQRINTMASPMFVVQADYEHIAKVLTYKVRARFQPDGELVDAKAPGFRDSQAV